MGIISAKYSSSVVDGGGVGMMGVGVGVGVGVGFGGLTMGFLRA